MMVMAGVAPDELLLPGTGERPHHGRALFAGRAGLLDGVRGPEAAQLRARRPVYGRGVYRLFRDPVVRRGGPPDDPGAAAACDPVRSGGGPGPRPVRRHRA